MRPPVFQILTASAQVTAIVAERIYWSGIAQQEQPAPFIVLQIVSAVPENTLSCTPEFDDQRVQIDCYSPSEQQASVLARAVRDAIEQEAHIVFGPVDLYEPEAKFYRWTMDATFFNDR